MKILHYFDRVRSEEGGTMRATLDICGAMARLGHDVTLVTYDDTDAPAPWKTGDPQASSPRPPRVVRVEAPARPGRFFSRSQLKGIDAIVAQADVVHLHGMWIPSNLQVARACRRVGVPYIVSSHGMLGDFSLNMKPVKKKVFLLLCGNAFVRHAAQVHFTSTEELAQAQARLPVNKGVVVPLLVDLAPFANLPGPQAARAAFPPLASGRPVILLTGRLVHNKGGDVLAEAAAILKSRGVDAVVALAGGPEGGFVGTLRELIDRLGVKDRVVLLGMVTGDLKLSVYQAADVFALPSVHENFGLVVPEAVLCCGVAPVVSPGVMIASELEAAGGCVVADRTAPAFADAIAALLADAPCRGEIVRAGRAWVHTALDERRIGAQFEKMYDASASAANRTPAATLS